MKEFPPFELDTVNQCLWRHADGVSRQPVALAPKAFALLQYLVEHPGRLVTHNELLESLWPQTFVQPDVLKTHILQIRTALGDNPKDPVYIKTLARRGYQFIGPLRDQHVRGHRGPLIQASSKFVGRNQFVRELHDDLSAATNGQRQIVFITGEPGIGKTALADEFQRQVAIDAPGIRIARAQCIEGYGGKEPYYPMLEALDQLCRVPGGESIVQLLAVQAPTWLIQFPALMKHGRPETLRRETWGATRERMLREIGEVLETITSKDPLLLVFEDLHWVDHSTVDLISALARRRTPSRMMLIGTYRPVDVALSKHPLNALKQDLLVHQLCHELALDPLGEAEVAAYLAGGASQSDLPYGLAGLVHRHSEGNPLFMVAALDHLAGRGFISRDQGTWKLGVPLEEIDLGVPESLRQMIEVQIDRLTPEEQQTLEVASITVTGFNARVTALAANLDPERVEELCEGLSRRYHVVRSAGSLRFPDGAFSPRYEFAHTLYREVFYRRQSLGRRAKLHRNIGDQLEILFAGRLNEVATELAHHFEEGSDWLKAVKYLRLVAETAGHRYAPAEATRVLHHALELSKKMPEGERAVNETEILEKLAAMYVVSFDMRALETYEALRTRAAYYGLIDVEVRALIDIVYPLSWISSQRSLEAVHQALELSAGQKDPLRRARTRASCLVRRIWIGGWNAQDAEDCRNALLEIRATGDPAIYAWAVLDCNFLEWCSSHYREANRNALEHLSLLLEGYEDNPYLSFDYWLSQFIQPWSLLFLGEWGEALRVIKTGVASATKNGDYFRSQTLLIYQAWVHLQALDFSGVLAICESVLSSLEGSARSPWRRLCRALTAAAEVATGSYKPAMENLAAVTEEMAQQTVIHDWYSDMLLQSAITELWLAKGDLRRARVEAERFLHVTQNTAERTWQALAWESNARVAIAEHSPRQAQDCIANALSTMQGFEVPLAAWRVHATAAIFFDSTGSTEQSYRHCELSRATILKLADSLTGEGSLRQTFLSAPDVSEILAHPACDWRKTAGNLSPEIIPT
jgi:DNA-binding winged helix-turn-helix (wHTH) protein